MEIKSTLMIVLIVRFPVVEMESSRLLAQKLKNAMAVGVTLFPHKDPAPINAWTMSVGITGLIETLKNAMMETTISSIPVQVYALSLNAEMK